MSKRNFNANRQGPSRPSKKTKLKRKQNNNNNLKIVERSMPVSRSYSVLNRKPSFKNTNRGQIISGQQLLLEIDGSTSFLGQSLDINPGLEDFKWLREIAKNYDKYFFRKLVFIYKPSNAVTTTSGQVYMTVDFDVADAPPETLSDLSTYEIQSNGPVYSVSRLNIPVKSMFDGIAHKRIRQGPVGGDLQTYDGGKFSIYTSACLNSSPVGQLWYDFEVEFISPQTTGPVQQPTSYNRYIHGNASAGLVDSITLDVIFQHKITGCMKLKLSENNNLFFTLPCGKYYVQTQVSMEAENGQFVRSEIEFWKNGNPLTSPVRNIVTVPVNGLTTLAQNMNCYVESSGIDEFKVVITASGTPLSNPVQILRIVGAAGTWINFTAL